MKVVSIISLVALGMALGWVVAAQYYAVEPAPSALPLALERPSAEAGPPAEPQLRGMAPLAPPPPPARHPEETPPAAGAPVPSVVAEMDDEEIWEDIVVFEEEIPQPDSIDQRGWHALLTLYAMAGRTEDFLRAAPKGAAAGIQPSTLLELLQLMPTFDQVNAADRLQQLLPEADWPITTLANLYITGGAPDRAVDVIVPALEATPNEDLARLLISADPDRAARVIGAMAAGDAWNGELLGEVGQALSNAERPDLALPFLQDSLAREPMGHSVLMTLSNVDPELALAHAKFLTSERPDEGQVWQWLGQLELKGGNSAAAFEAYKAAGERSLNTDIIYGLMKADPARAYDAAIELTSETSDDEMLGAVAKVALKSDRPAESLASLLRAHDRDPTDHEWNWAMVVLDPVAAVEALGESARSFSGDSRDEVVGAYGNALLANGQGHEAFASYLEAHEEDPSDWEWQRGLARADPQRALPILEERLKTNADEGDLAGALADAYAGTGREERALELYEQAIKQGGGVEWYARMALVDSEKAYSGLQEAIGSAPKSAENWAALGDYHRLRGDTAEARHAYDRARGISPTVLIYEIRWRSMTD